MNKSIDAGTYHLPVQCPQCGTREGFTSDLDTGVAKCRCCPYVGVNSDFLNIDQMNELVEQIQKERGLPDGISFRIDDITFIDPMAGIRIPDQK